MLIQHGLLQWRVGAGSPEDSITIDPAVCHRRDKGELSFVIGAEAGAYHDTLAGPSFSVSPVMFSLIADVWADGAASARLQDIVIVAAVICVLVSEPLIAVYQKAHAVSID